MKDIPLLGRGRHHEAVCKVCEGIDLCDSSRDGGAQFERLALSNLFV